MIQLLTAWNGYNPGVYSEFGTALEATLIAGGLAVEWAPPTVWVPFVGGNYYGTRKAELLGDVESLVPSGETSAGWLSAFGNGETWVDLPLDASVAFTASIAGTVLTITAVGIGTMPNGTTIAGAIKRGHYITGDAGIPADTYIVSRGTGTGLTGTYNLSADCGTIGSKTLYASCIDGVGGCIERVTDTFIGDSTTADQDKRAAWRMTILPTHQTIVGQGRTNLRSAILTQGKEYRVEFGIRLHQHSGSGWSTLDSNTSLPLMWFFAMAQDYGPYDEADSLGFGEQAADGGPLQLLYDRGALRPNIQTMREDGPVLAADGKWSWGTGDRRSADDGRAFVPMIGTNVKHVVFELRLDHRLRSEGGIGYAKCWINQRLIMDHIGPTCFPHGRVENVIGECNFVFGMYDFTESPLGVDGDCSGHASLYTQRSLHFQYIRILEGGV